MLESLITSKTHIKLLLKFFLNSSTSAHRRRPEGKFGESTNATHPVLNRFEQAGLLTARTEGNRKIYLAGICHPLNTRISQRMRNRPDIGQRAAQGINKPGKVEKVYHTSTFTRRQENPDTNILPSGFQIVASCPNRLIKKAGSLIKTKRKSLRLGIRPLEQLIVSLRHDSPLLWRFNN